MSVKCLSKSSLPKGKPHKPHPTLSGDSLKDDYIQPKELLSQTPQLCSQQSLDLISYFPKTTMARPKIHVKNLSTNIFHVENDTKSKQQSPKNFRLLKANKKGHTKSTIKLARPDPDYCSIFLEDTTNSQQAKSPFFEGRVFLQEYGKSDKGSPIRSRGNSLGLFPTSLLSSMSIAGSPGSLRMEEGLKPRPPKMKASNDQQRIATRAALKYFSSIQEIGSAKLAKKQQLSPLRGTKQFVNSQEITRMLKGKINTLIQSNKNVSPPSRKSNIRIHSRLAPQRIEDYWD